MLAVGLWSAAALPAVRRLAAPALFLCALLAGALAGAQTGAGGLVEVGVAFSVVLFGVALLARRQLPLAAGFALVAAAGALHGVAHTGIDDNAVAHGRNIKSVYVYEAPVRIWHWINAAVHHRAGLTGYFIGSPLPTHAGRGE
jgi:hydrogenase/urease accessory protein HupE